MPARFNKIFFICLLFLLSAGGPAWSGENDRVLVLGDAPRYDLAQYLEVLDGEGGGLTIDQVSTLPWRERFKPGETSRLDSKRRCAWTVH